MHTSLSLPPSLVPKALRIANKYEYQGIRDVGLDLMLEFCPHYLEKWKEDKPVACSWLIHLNNF